MLRSPSITIYTGIINKIQLRIFFSMKVTIMQQSFATLRMYSEVQKHYYRVIFLGFFLNFQQHYDIIRLSEKIMNTYC